jgi:penicillin-binding protein-related factor A (putative recombinase)
MSKRRLIQNQEIVCQLVGNTQIDLQQVKHLETLKEQNGTPTTHIVMSKLSQTYFIAGKDMFQVADEWGVTLGPV